MKLLLGGSPCTHWSIAQTRKQGRLNNSCPGDLVFSLEEALSTACCRGKQATEESDLLDGVPAINGNNGSAHEVRLIAGQEEDQLSYLFRGTEATHRDIILMNEF